MFVFKIDLMDNLLIKKEPMFLAFYMSFHRRWKTIVFPAG